MLNKLSYFFQYKFKLTNFSNPNLNQLIRIIGGLNKESNDKVKNFYNSFVNGEIFVTDARTAEMCKLVENSYRDLNIAFANELSIICDGANINVNELINMANNFEVKTFFENQEEE